MLKGDDRKASLRPKLADPLFHQRIIAVRRTGSGFRSGGVTFFFPVAAEKSEPVAVVVDKNRALTFGKRPSAAVVWKPRLIVKIERIVNRVIAEILKMVP